MVAERVLIVDDNPFNVKLARRLLASEGFDVRSAATPGAALETVGQWAPQLILMDLQLPGMDGLTLTRRLRDDAATERTVIVAFSAETTSSDERRALEAGFDGFIAKPIDTRQFGSRVRSYLAARRSADLR
jgi:two-component system, cell cycle response regulator DivK